MRSSAGCWFRSRRRFFQFLEIPNWVVRLIVIVAGRDRISDRARHRVGVRTDAGRNQAHGRCRSCRRSDGRKTHAWIYVVVVGAAFSIGLFFIGRYTARKSHASAARTEAATGSSIPQKSIAVLPFENLSDDKGAAYFADGIQDEILTKLASIADLKVISRTSTAKYKSKPEDLKTVSQQLGVATVLEGSVQKAADKVRVNVQLIDARADSHLWAKTYDRDIARCLCGPERSRAGNCRFAEGETFAGRSQHSSRRAPTKDTRPMIFFSKASSNSVSPTAISGRNHSTRQRAGTRKRSRATRISPWPSRNWLSAGCGVIG